MRQNRHTWNVKTSQQLGRALRSFRMQHGLTQQQLADQVGVHRRVLARLENGETTKQLRMLLELLLALGVEMRLEQARPENTDATLGPKDGL